MPFDLATEQAFEYGQLALSIGLVLLLGLFIYLILYRGLNALFDNNYFSESVHGVLNLLLRWAMIIMVGLVVLQQLGVRVASVWAALSAVVVLLGVGLVAVWSVASNIFCSLLLLVFRPFSIGDTIEIVEPTGGPGLGGKVVNLNVLYTYLQETNENGVPETLVQVPNNIFFQKSIVSSQFFVVEQVQTRI